MGPRSYGGTMGRGGAPPGEMVDTVTVGCGAGVNSLTKNMNEEILSGNSEVY